MTKVLLVAATAALALGTADVALAETTYTDASGDSETAPDITAVTAAHDASGNLTFTVRTSHVALAADSLVDIAFDTDLNPDTGVSGVEYLFLVGSTGWQFVRWDGTRFVPAGASSANGSYANGVATFKVNKDDLGAVAKFSFWAGSHQLDANGNVVAEDTAPEGTNAYVYALTQRLRLVAGTPVAVPAKPAAGKAFAVRTRVARSDSRAALRTGVVTCTVRIGGVPLRATGRMRNGSAVCAMKLPAMAKGKLVRVTIKVTFAGASTTSTFSARAR
jgi:hypothetical protein